MQNNKNIADLIEEFLSYIFGVRNVSPRTVESYRNDMAHFLQMIDKDAPLSSITLADLQICIASLSEQNYAATSINRFISALRTFFDYCYRLGYISTNPAARLKNIKAPQKMPKFLFQSESDELCAMPDKLNILWPVRDKAIIECLYSSGCRVSELAGIKIADLDKNLRSAIVLGKGSKERRVYFSPEAAVALKEYLEDRLKKFPRAKDMPEVFLNMQGNKISRTSIYTVISRYSGVEGTNHPVSPHALRHTFATTMLNNGADIRIVQELLGHANISTTQRYTHVTTAQLVKTYNQAHPHGSGAEIDKEILPAEEKQKK